MSPPDTILKLRYVGKRFDGCRLPLAVITDLPALRDLIVAYAKEKWRSDHPNKERLPKGFDKIFNFDLVALEDGSAMPNLAWQGTQLQQTLPGFNVYQEIFDHSCGLVFKLIEEGAEAGPLPPLSSEHLRALNRFGAGLKDDEKIEFVGRKDKYDKILYMDALRRKQTITRLTQTYQVRYEGIGNLVGLHTSDKVINVQTADHGEITISLAPDRISADFDGNTGQCVQFVLQIELDGNDRYKRVVEVFEVDVVIDAVTRCMERIDELARLQPGWLDGDGAALSDLAIKTSKYLLLSRQEYASRISIFPMPEGGIAFEFINNGWDYTIEFKMDGGVEMFGVQINGTDEMDPIKLPVADNDFLKVFDSRMRS